MMLRLRRLSRDREGQSIVLAAIGLLILSIGVLATVNLGHAIHERIRLQNTADAGAYSLAAVEARAFNFMAFTNRAQVSHYITAMSIQSWLAMVWFIDALLGTLADLCSWIQVLACLFSWVPGVALIKKAANIAYKALDKAHQLYRKFAEKADPILGKIVYYIPKVNQYGVYNTQRLMKGLALVNVVASGRNVVYDNDPEIDVSVWNFVTGAFNLLEFNQIFDTASGNLPSPSSGGSSDEAKAMRVMNEISNATRYPDFITNRSLANALKKLFANIPGVGALFQVLYDLLPIKIEPTGQTKLTSYKKSMDMNQSRCVYRFGTKWDHSRLSKGNVLVADEVLEIKIWFGKWHSRPISQKIISIWAATGNEGEHCQHDRKKINTYICGKFHWPKPKCMGDSGNHKWDGIMPYIKFKPNSDHTKDFHQPSTYVFLNKKPEDLGSPVYEQHFTFTNNEQSEEIDTRLSASESLVPGSFADGLNAWSRGMAYYHRPTDSSGRSNWREHPNFFNPFWRAKLAPLSEKANNLSSKIPLAGQFGEYFFNEFLTH